MQREFIVAIRNDQSQLLVMEPHAGLPPVFPGGVIHPGNLLKLMVDRLYSDTGLGISGFHLASVGKPRHDQEVHRYTAHVEGGKLHDFSAPVDRHGSTLKYASASWVAPTLIRKLNGVSKDMLELVNDLSWMMMRPA